MAGIYGNHPEDRYFEAMLYKHMERNDEPEKLDFQEWYGANYEGYETIAEDIERIVELSASAWARNEEAVRELIVTAHRIKQKFEAGRVL